MGWKNIIKPMFECSKSYFHTFSFVKNFPFENWKNVGFKWFVFFTLFRKSLQRANICWVSGHIQTRLGRPRVFKPLIFPSQIEYARTNDDFCLSSLFECVNQNFYDLSSLFRIEKKIRVKLCYNEITLVTNNELWIA